MNLRIFIERLIHHGLEVFGKYYSSYRGYVIDNEDPEGMGRIKVQVPVISKDKTIPVWAWPKHNFAGSNYGMQLLPVKGDIVWVEFEMGNVTSPMWHHGHYARGEKPMEFATAQVYGFKTPKGQIVIIDDRDGVEKVIVNSIEQMVFDSKKVILGGKEIYLNGEIRGTPKFKIGANGAFSTVDGHIVKVTNGLITSII